MDNTQEYRILREGEIIQAGDEADASRTPFDDVKWLPVSEHMVGRKAPNPLLLAHTIFRRPVKLTDGE